jgi:hypothetical protein
MTETDTTDIALEAVKRVNPLLERRNKLPPTTIRLPSRGLFYNNGELDSECIDGEVNIFPMTTTDELIMRSIDMLFQGTAIESVIGRCLPQIKKPMALLVGDVDYILTQLRKISYGSRIPIRYNCSCITDPVQVAKLEQAGDNEYLIPVDHFIQSTQEISAKTLTKAFTLTIPSGERVTLSPLRIGDFIKIQHMDDVDRLKDVANIKEYIIANYTAVTASVDEITDKALIADWYAVLPRLDAERIKDKLNSMDNWGITFTYTITCKQCKEKRELTTQLNPMYFFMLPSSPETKQK